MQQILKSAGATAFQRFRIEALFPKCPTWPSPFQLWKNPSRVLPSRFQEMSLSSAVASFWNAEHVLNLSVLIAFWVIYPNFFFRVKIDKKHLVNPHHREVPKWGTPPVGMSKNCAKQHSQKAWIHKDPEVPKAPSTSPIKSHRWMFFWTIGTSARWMLFFVEPLWMNDECYGNKIERHLENKRPERMRWDSSDLTFNESSDHKALSKRINGGLHNIQKIYNKTSLSRV